MPDYAPTIITSNVLDGNALDGVIRDDLPCLRAAEDFTTVTSYDPTSANDFAKISDLGVTLTVSDDEIVFVTATFSVSAPDQLDRWKFRIYANSTPGLTVYYISSKSSDTTGEVDPVCLITGWTGLSGSVTFEARWARTGASGDPIYGRAGQIEALAFKLRS